MPAALFRLLILSLLASTFSFAQTASKDGLWLAPVCKPKLYGLQNNQGGVAIEPKYDMMSEQTGNTWIVTTKGKEGVINSKGEYLIKPNFETITQFLNGKAVAGKLVKRNPYGEYSSDDYSDSVVSYGIIDESGTWIIDPAYSWLMLCPDGSIEFTNKNNEYGFLNPDGSILLRAQYVYASVMTNGVAIIIDQVTRDKYPAKYYSYDDHNRMREGDYFLINHSGEKLNAVPYDLIRNFSGSRAAFNKGGIWKRKTYDDQSILSGGKWGFLDEKGNEVIAADYDYVYDFENGKAKVRVGEKTFWIDQNGKECAPPEMKAGKEFTIFCQTGFFGYIDLKGKWVIEPQFYAADNFSEGLAAAMPLRASDMDCETEQPTAVGDYQDFDDYTYRILPKYDLLGVGGRGADHYAQLMIDSLIKADSLARVEQMKRRLYGYIDATGNFVLPPKYEVAFPFKDGRAYVRFRGKWGVIDKTGKWIMAPVMETPSQLSYMDSYYGGYRSIYNDAYNPAMLLDANKPYEFFSFNEGMGGVYKYNKYGFIDSTGKIIVAPVYDEALPFSQGLAAVRLNDKWGFIDKTGKEVIPLKFREASSFTKDGLAMVGSQPIASDPTLTDVELEYESDNNVYYGYIDKSGKWIIKPQFSYAEDFSEGLAAAALDYGDRGYIDKTGKFVIAPKYDNTYPFSHGYALVKIRMYQPVYIDKTGKVNKSISPNRGVFDKSVPVVVDYDFSDLAGFVNEKGEEIIPHVYRAAGNFVRVK